MNTGNEAKELIRLINILLDDVDNVRMLEVIKWMLLTNQ